MKASEISQLDVLPGNEILIEGFLHSDTVNVWLNDEPRSEEQQVTVVDPRINAILLSSFPPRLGSVFAYYFECKASGTVRFDEERHATLYDISSLEIEWSGTRRKLI